MRSLNNSIILTTILQHDESNIILTVLRFLLFGIIFSRCKNTSYFPTRQTEYKLGCPLFRLAKVVFDHSALESKFSCFLRLLEVSWVLHQLFAEPRHRLHFLSIFSWLYSHPKPYYWIQQKPVWGYLQYAASCHWFHFWNISD